MNAHAGNPPPGAEDSSASIRAEHAAQVGMLEWFWMDDYMPAEQTIAALRALGIQYLRFGVSWADYLREGGREWYDWLIPHLAEHFELLPCFVYTPPSLGEVPSVASPPRDPKAYADFLDTCITRYGQHFDYVELWNEPNNLHEWNYNMDRAWTRFCATVGGAAHWARKRGKKTVLGGMSPIDPHWLDAMFDNGLMPYIDVVGVHAFPGGYDLPGESCLARIDQVARVLHEHDHPAPIWLTETGYSTWRHNEFEQVRVMAEAQSLPVERIYWLTLRDLAQERPSVTGFHNDPRDYHFGLQTENGTPKLLHRLWSTYGLEGVTRAARWPTPRLSPEPCTVVTGGAGFIGCNLADRLASEGRRVRLLDNLSRAGVEKNLRWLRERHGKAIEFVPCDTRDRPAVREAIAGATQIFHLAAQVAVTTSLDDPLTDFEINLGGTLNLLDAARRQPRVPGIVFASTNKVYGGLEDVALEVAEQRYRPVDPLLRAHGIGESRPLDFHSPYGCSKGGADQYILDHARCMGVPAVVFRMSCIYGPHQFGTEDQGWVAHFLIRALKEQPITLYGDGMQVRDILHVDDLVQAYLIAEREMAHLSGQAFNMGGGPPNTISLLELLTWIERLEGRRPAITFADWRAGDQRYYVSDTRRFSRATGWHARTTSRDGVAALYQWLRDSLHVIPERADAAPQENVCPTRTSNA
ncbi:MAG TPA: NAD-dependent epimerase/dehydratase family protein [Oleiagrimonas sp.]|nr:NAD-dependent epimerase/dehydratase family protein [Oleiagrimonas sp.]